MPKLIALALVVASLSSCSAASKARRLRARCEQVCEAGGMQLKGLQVGKLSGRVRANTSACVCELAEPVTSARR